MIGDTEPTPALDEFLVRFEADSNDWWRISCGHHLNLFEAAVAERNMYRQKAHEFIRLVQLYDTELGALTGQEPTP